MVTQLRKCGTGHGGPLERLLSPEFFKALCEPQRLAILCELVRAGAPRTVGEVAAACPVDLSVVSRHIRALRQCGILACEKRGKEVFCSVDTDSLVRSLRAIADAIEGFGRKRGRS